MIVATTINRHQCINKQQFYCEKLMFLKKTITLYIPKALYFRIQSSETQLKRFLQTKLKQETVMWAAFR